MRTIREETIHMSALSIHTVKIEVIGRKTYVTLPSFNGQNAQRMEVKPGQSVETYLSFASQSTLVSRVSQTGMPEVTSEPSHSRPDPSEPVPDTSWMRGQSKRRKPRRSSGGWGENYEPPDDTPSLDTSFHDHEMDV